MANTIAKTYFWSLCHTEHLMAPWESWECLLAFPEVPQIEDNKDTMALIARSIDGTEFAFTQMPGHLCQCLPILHSEWDNLQSLTCACIHVLHVLGMAISNSAKRLHHMHQWQDKG